MTWIEYVFDMLWYKIVVKVIFKLKKNKVGPTKQVEYLNKMLGAVKERIEKDGNDDGGGVYMFDCSKLNTLPSKIFFSTQY